MSVTPLTARTRADRALVGLIFSGLVRLGPGDTLVPDLAESWTSDAKGKTWTFKLRAGATWHDGQPVTSTDIVFTADALRSPDIAGPAAASWAEVRATAIDDQTVRFTLDTPLAGFLQAATQPILPEHLLAAVPLPDLATDPFGREPIGSGPYRLKALLDDRALLERVPDDTSGTSEASPSPSSDASASPSSGASASPSSDASASPSSPASASPTSSASPSSGASASPTSSAPPKSSAAPSSPASSRGVPVERIELRFFDDAQSLADAFRSGDLDAASGLRAATLGSLATDTGTSVLRYPTTTLSAVLLDLRPSGHALRYARVRRALLSGLDRDALITGPLAGAAIRADSLVPPASWAFDAASAPRVAFDVKAAAKLLRAAGWKKVDRSWRAPRAKRPFTLEVLAPTAEASPAVHALAAAVVEAWGRLGLRATLVAVDPAELVTRLRQGRFAAAVVDIAFNLDPDLYPLLASTQATSRGGNVSGIQDHQLDTLLVAARKSAKPAARMAAYKALLAYLAQSQPILPLAWRDEMVVQRGVDGPVPRLIVAPGDRYHDVLTWRLAVGG